ncbi:TIGR02678 family protein (plasmid) [Streptomyces sp. NBC_01340]|uniref:TIGR02678 family protein n=1 Tax=unclassified Streptomyces TaxID=2593676 RepID=UPI0022519946|nr:MULTISPECIES: TIGR02678 family protein [unclassified Streptomyces]MCX4460188.1 TIGR02678 family protein [Streptomyces sp. NBC_01719]MCX4500481.1 TIGR02678 family protein [Streptomyces sp. NBC_01728]WSI45514.1 TIGR02678 family protein [Streptomyces sp. NBC_01340]
MSRVAEGVSPLELADYQKAVRLVLRHPLVTPGYPDKAALATVRRWAGQLRTDLMEVLGYRLVTTADTARLQRAQDGLDATRPALTRAGRPFDRRRYAYLVLTLAALGRHGAQVALGELADAVAADAVRIDGLGLDTARKPDRDAFVDAVTWLTERGALTLADGSATAWAGDPERAEALYDIDREILLAIHHPTRVLQHLSSVTALLDSAGALGMSAGRAAQRRDQARRARRLVLENPVAYYADADTELLGQLRAPALAEDLERLTGLTVERRAEGVALIDTSGRLSDIRFPGGGTVAQAALLLAARISAAVQRSGRHALELLPAPTTAERLVARARRIDGALPTRSAIAEFATPDEPDAGAAYETLEPYDDHDEAGEERGETRYPFVTDSWLRGRLKEITGEYGAGFAADLRGDPDRLLDQALALLAAMSLIVRVDGGVLVLPLLARYRGVTARVKTRTAAQPPTHTAPAQTALFADDTAKDPTP